MAPAEAAPPDTTTAGLPQQAEHDAREPVKKRRSRSTSRDDRQRSTSREHRLIIENTFFRLVSGDEARSATPPGVRRRPRASSLPSPDRATYNALEAPYLPSEVSPIDGDGHRRYRSRPHEANEAEREGALDAVQEGDEECEVAEVLTTVVIRNMPQAYTRDMFLKLLDSEGFENQYDFVYVPLDFGLQCSFGYAFCNMVSPQAAQKFHEVFAGYSQWKVPWGQDAEVGWATLQGLEKHVEKYRNSPVMHESVGHEARPILIKDGKRVEFPLPTKKIGLVKRLRTRRRSTDADAGDAVAPKLHDMEYQDQNTDEELQPTRGKFKALLRPPPPDMAQSPLLAGLYAMPHQPKQQPEDSHGARAGNRRQVQRAATTGQHGAQGPEAGPARPGPPGHFSRTRTGPLSTSSLGYETASVHSDASSRVSHQRWLVGQQGQSCDTFSDASSFSDASTRVPTSPTRRGRSDVSKQLSSSSGGSHGKHHSKVYKHSLLAGGLQPARLLAGGLLPCQDQAPETQTKRPVPWSPPCSTPPYGASQCGWASALA